jgi:hypothetical protein
MLARRTILAPPTILALPILAWIITQLPSAIVLMFCTLIVIGTLLLDIFLGTPAFASEWTAHRPMTRDRRRSS